MPDDDLIADTADVIRKGVDSRDSWLEIARAALAVALRNASAKHLSRFAISPRHRRESE